MNSVEHHSVGCLSQFFIRPPLRNQGIGSHLFHAAIKWIQSFVEIRDVFIFVSNGNANALDFYINKGFRRSHNILDGFIIVLRNSLPPI